MMLQSRRENGLEERLYPQGDLQLAKQKDWPKWRGRFALFVLFAAGIFLGSAAFSQLEESRCREGISLNTKEVARTTRGVSLMA